MSDINPRALGTNSNNKERNPVLVPDPPYYKYTPTPTTPSIPETLQTSAAETPPEVDLPRDPLHSPHAHHPRLSAKVPSDNNFMIPISRGEQQLDFYGDDLWYDSQQYLNQPEQPTQQQHPQCSHPQRPTNYYYDLVVTVPHCAGSNSNTSVFFPAAAQQQQSQQEQQQQHHYPSENTPRHKAPPRNDET